MLSSLIVFLYNMMVLFGQLKGYLPCNFFINCLIYISVIMTCPRKLVFMLIFLTYLQKKENGKRRKPEDYYAGKKTKDRKVISTQKHQLVDDSMININTIVPGYNLKREYQDLLIIFILFLVAPYGLFKISMLSLKLFQLFCFCFGQSTKTNYK